MEAPEKIYLVNDDLNIEQKWYKTKQVGFETTEYTRTDAFIERVINFLNYKLDDVVAARLPGTIIPHHIAKQELIEDFRKSINDYDKPTLY